jgi:hypothetical protein
MCWNGLQTCERGEVRTRFDGGRVKHTDGSTNHTFRSYDQQLPRQANYSVVYRSSPRESNQMR